MTNRATPEFWAAYSALPKEVRKLAQKNYALFRNDPRHPSLRLKKIGDRWSVRVGRNHRALAIEISEGLLWTWIGSHAEYERIVDP